MAKKTKKKSKAKKSVRAKAPRVSKNPVVRFAKRLSVATQGLEDVFAIVNPKNVVPHDQVVAKLYKEIATIVEKALKESA